MSSKFGIVVDKGLVQLTTTGMLTFLEASKTKLNLIKSQQVLLRENNIMFKGLSEEYITELIESFDKEIFLIKEAE